MSNFNNKTITSKGLELLSSTLSGGKLEFTRIVMGDGAYEGDIGSIESLVSQKQSLDIKSITKKGSQVILSTTLLQSAITEDFYWKELGIYAKGNDDIEVLYMYGSAIDTSFISKDMLNEKMINVGVLVSNAQNVTATIDGSLVYLSRADLDDHNNDENSHPSIKDWVNKLVGGIKLTWEGITGKPDTFPPSKHEHTASEVGASPSNHEHDFGYFKTLRGGTTDFDYALTEGQYMIGGTNIPHAPKSGEIWGMLLVYVSDGNRHNNLNNWIWQHAYLADGTDWQRNKVNGDSWSGWTRIHPKYPADIGASPTSHTHNDKANTSGRYTNLITGGIQIRDTRDENQSPSWYMITYPQSIIAEFKNASVIGLPNAGYTHCLLETRIPWGHVSGGYPTQIAYKHTAKLSPMIRYGIDENTWGEWRELGGGSVIKSIQRGTAGGGDGVTVKISTVNPSKSFVIGGSTEYRNGTELNPHSTAQLIDATTVQFVGHSLGNQPWQVIEFN